MPYEIREAIAANPIISATGTRNGTAGRYGSPEKGFLNVRSNRGYTSAEYSGTNGHGWSVNTSNGRITGWSIY